MIDQKHFAAGLVKMGRALGRTLDELDLEVYWEVCGGAFDDQQWAGVVHAVLFDATVLKLPTPAQFLERGRALSGEPSADLEAARAYDAVREKGWVYTPESGEVWTERKVLEECGPAAAVAFVTAGGNAVFQRESPEWVRKRFVEAYVAEARTERGRLVSGAPQLTEGA